MAGGPDQRRFARVGLVAQVHLTVPGMEALDAMSQDISEGGMFLATRRPLAVGRSVELHVTIGANEVLEAKAIVVWARVEPGAAGPAGMGIEFREISPAGRELIRKLVSQRKP